MPKTKGQQLKDHWTSYGVEHLKGRTIVDVRYMNNVEMDAHGWRELALVLVLDNGTCIYPSVDTEGNEAGTLFGVSKDGDLTFPSIPDLP